MKSRIFALLIAFTFIFTTLTVNVYADDTTPPLATNLQWSTTTPGEFSFDVRATISGSDDEYFAVSLYKDNEFVYSIMGMHTSDTVTTQTYNISTFFRNSTPSDGNYVFTIGPGDDTDIKSPVYTYSSSSSSTTTTPAATASSVNVVLTIGSAAYTNNGQNAEGDVAPYISSDGRTMVPIRIISEALGATVDWDNSTQTDTIQKSGITLQITVGQALPDGLGMAVLKDDRLFVPVRYVSEQLGANVDWNADAQTVTITQ